MFADVCTLDVEESGTWKNIGNGVYELTVDGDSSPYHITFSNNLISWSEEDGVATAIQVYQKKYKHL